MKFQDAKIDMAIFSYTGRSHRWTRHQESNCCVPESCGKFFLMQNKCYKSKGIKEEIEIEKCDNYIIVQWQLPYTIQ